MNCDILFYKAVTESNELVAILYISQGRVNKCSKKVV